MKLNLCLILLLSNLSVGLSSSPTEEIDSDVERMMKKRKRKKTRTTFSPTTPIEDVTRFTRSYLTVVGDQVTGNSGGGPIERSNTLGSSSFATGKLNTGFGIGIGSANKNKNFSVRGSSFLQNGPIFNPDDVKFIDCIKQPNKDSCEESLTDSNIGGFQSNRPLRYGGGKQPNVFNIRPPRQNYFFNGECTTVAGFGASQILAHSCFYNLCLGGLGEDCVNIYAGGGFIFDPFSVVMPGEEPLLPPSFPGAVIGGTGKYQGIKGTAQIVTITTRTGANLEFNISFGQSVLPSLSPQTGYFTQLIQLETSMMLPPSATQEEPE